MRIYVYQLSDTEFGAGFVRDECQRRGRIVEEWDVSTLENAQYVERNGSKYGNAKARVTQLAALAINLILADGKLQGGMILTDEEWRAVVAEKSKTIEAAFSERLKVMDDKYRADRNEMSEAFRSKTESDRLAYATALKACNDSREERVRDLLRAQDIAELRIADLERQIAEQSSAHTEQIIGLEAEAIAARNKMAANHRAEIVEAVETAKHRARTHAYEDACKALSKYRLRNAWRLLTGKRIRDAIEGTH